MSLWNKEKDVNIQDQTSFPFRYYMIREDKIDINLPSGATKGDTVIVVSSGHGFTAPATPDDWITIWEGGAYSQSKVIAVSGDNVTIDTPLARSYTSAAIVIRGKVDLNLDGSSSPVTFKFKIHGTSLIPIDIIFAKVLMVHAGDGDMTLYGDVASLDEGVKIKRNGGGISYNFGDYHNTGDYSEAGWDITFDQKGGGGNYATRCAIDIKKIYGVALRFDPRTEQYLEGQIEDDLTDLSLHRIILYGQYTEGE